ncbi:MAG: hypothetical protein RMK89_05040 [Armatimonadota bacterium]|nr:hypothetical protein [Armatimonadota bacterium]MDW8142810.1 hypothetical protein [Armatimonadota bacterium]
MWKPTLDEIERLYEKHAKQLEATHWGKFLAITSDGQFILGEDDVEVIDEASKKFGQGNFILMRVGIKSAYRLRQVQVVSRHYPFLDVDWQVRQYRERSQAYADTGFEVSLCVPEDRRSHLGEAVTSVQVTLADASSQIQDLFRGTVAIVGINETLPAAILALGDEFLLGRRILDRYRVTFDRGRQIIVERT